MIGDRLSEIRKDCGMSREELAKELGLSIHTIKSYEQNNSSPDDEVKVKIAKLFNISLDYLLGATRLEKPLIDATTLELPKGFPSELVEKVNESIEILLNSYKYLNQKK